MKNAKLEETLNHTVSNIRFNFFHVNYGDQVPILAWNSNLLKLDLPAEYEGDSRAIANDH